MQVKEVLPFRAFRFASNSVFQALHGNLLEKLKACLEDTRLELCRRPENDSLMPLLGDQTICNMISSNALSRAPYAFRL